MVNAIYSLVCIYITIPGHIGNVSYRNTKYGVQRRNVLLITRRSAQELEIGRWILEL